MQVVCWQPGSAVAKAAAFATELSGCVMNGCLINHYVGCNPGIPCHKDRVSHLLQHETVTMSNGADRQQETLKHGDVVLMGGKYHHEFTHGGDGTGKYQGATEYLCTLAEESAAPELGRRSRHASPSIWN
eukprot:gene23365-1437_t